MQKKPCTVGLCPGPEKGCWLEAYLIDPAPTPPGVERDDVSAVRRMGKCPKRRKLRENYPDIFKEALRRKPKT